MNLVFADGSLYDSKGAKTLSFDETFQVTRYTYDEFGRLASVSYPYSKEMFDYLSLNAVKSGLNYIDSSVEHGTTTLSASEQKKLQNLCASLNRSSQIQATVSSLTEWFSYDTEGNMIERKTPFGVIKCEFDSENRLLFWGRAGSASYDRNGNLLHSKDRYSEKEFSYNAQNRMKTSLVRDLRKNLVIESSYKYDPFGRRTLHSSSESGSTRTAYMGLSFRELCSFKVESEIEVRSHKINSEEQSVSRYLKTSGSGGFEKGGSAPASSSADRKKSGAFGNASLYALGDTPILLTSIGTESQADESEDSAYSTAALMSDLYGTVGASVGQDGALESYRYDVFGSPVSAQTAEFGFAGKHFDEATEMYDFGFRDYSSSHGRFSTQDPIRDGENWYSYCAGDPVNYVDLDGLAPKNMSNEDRNKYISKIQSYSEYDNSKNTMGIPDSYDCADVATYLYGQATADTSYGDLSGELIHAGEKIGSNIPPIHSSDFFKDNTKNITYYDDKSFNNKDIESGSVMVWQGPGITNGTGWIGHVATIVDVERDSENNVTNIKIIQGHTGGGTTKVDDIPNQADLNSYRGTFLGFGEIGENSTGAPKTQMLSDDFYIQGLSICKSLKNDFIESLMDRMSKNTNVEINPLKHEPVLLPDIYSREGKTVELLKNN